MTVTRGFYKHYKGPVYFVEYVGPLHDEKRRIVAYHSTRSVEERDGIRFRYEDEFEQWVHVGTDGLSGTGAAWQPPPKLSWAEYQFKKLSGWLPRFERVSSHEDMGR